jgi:hypothetical protein
LYCGEVADSRESAKSMTKREMKIGALGAPIPFAIFVLSRFRVN